MWKLRSHLTFCSFPPFAGLSERIEELEKQMGEAGEMNATGNFGTKLRSVNPEEGGEKWFITSASRKMTKTFLSTKPVKGLVIKGMVKIYVFMGSPFAHV